MPLSDKDKLEHAWRYFAVHASQRLTVFNFFILISGAAFAGLASAPRSNTRLELWASALGVLLSGVSFVFWKLEGRTQFLVKHAESVLKTLELRDPDAAFRVLSSEPPKTEGSRHEVGLLRRMWTYGEAFRIVYLTALVLGIAGAVFFAYQGFSSARGAPQPSCGFPHTITTHLQR